MIPDNASWYHAAYTVALTVYGLYVVTLWRRRARVRAERRRLEAAQLAAQRAAPRT